MYDTYMVEVHWYDGSCEEKISYHALRAKDWTGMVEQLNSYYGNDMVSFTATWCDMGMADLSKEEYERLLQENA